MYSANQDFSVTNCTFNSCFAEYDGGAIYLYSKNNNYLSVLSSTFNNCFAYLAGGAIYLYDENSQLSVQDSSFIGCTAFNGNGGAIRIGDQSYEFLLQATSFVDCSTRGDGSFGETGSGGALWMGSGDGRLNHIAFDNCSAFDYGGAVYITGPSDFAMSRVVPQTFS